MTCAWCGGSFQALTALRFCSSEYWSSLLARTPTAPRAGRDAHTAASAVNRCATASRRSTRVSRRLLSGVALPQRRPAALPTLPNLPCVRGVVGVMCLDAGCNERPAPQFHIETSIRAGPDCELPDAD